MALFRRASRGGSVMLALTVAAVLVAAPASAHNRLRAATPAPDAVLAKPPARVVLEFSDSLNPTYTQIIVTDPAKVKVPVSAPVVDGAKASVAFESVLPVGAYTVAYRVVSIDGHTLQGSYAFVFDDGTRRASTTPSAAATAAGDSRIGAGLVAAVVAGLVVAVGALAYVLVRRG